MSRTPPTRPVNAETGLTQRVRARLRSLAIDSPPIVILGFSGGVDSLALASLLAELQRQRLLRVIAVHVDHGLRSGSDVEQDAACDLAAAVAVECVRARLRNDVSELHPGVGLEEAARRERYRILAEVARDEGSALIALGHHQSDQAETVLLHLARGAGPQGAVGMAEWTRRRIPWWESTATAPISIWRPLLAETRVSIEAYVQKLGLTPIDDPSNALLDYARNRVRHDALPALNRVATGATAALARYASLAADDNALLDQLAAECLHTIERADGTLGGQDLRETDPALARRVVRRWVDDGSGGEVELTSQRTDAILDLVGNRRGGRLIEIGAGWRVSLVRDHLILEPASVNIGNL